MPPATAHSQRSWKSASWDSRRSSIHPIARTSRRWIFEFFPEIKAQLRGRRFDSGLELQIKTQKIVSSFDNIWYEDTYNKWVKRHRKCIAVNGDYVDKWVDMTIGEMWR